MVKLILNITYSIISSKTYNDRITGEYKVAIFILIVQKLKKTSFFEKSCKKYLKKEIEGTKLKQPQTRLWGIETHKLNQFLSQK